jgi:hypothetical protein
LHRLTTELASCRLWPCRWQIGRRYITAEGKIDAV